MSYSKKDLVKYRLSKAKEALEDGQILAIKERWDAAASRMYYACFYAASAYLASEEITALTHAGVKVAFNKQLIKTGKIDRDLGRLFNKLFSLRQEADYEDFISVEQDEVLPILAEVERFIHQVAKLINDDLV